VTARDRQSGMTMVEIMVAVLLVGIAAAFTFGIQVRTSGAFRDQATVAELQQTLRAVSDLVVRDLRLTGYRALMLRTANGAPLTDIYAVTVQNAAGGYGSDILRVQYANDAKLAHIPNGAVSTTDSSPVDDLGGFAAGDLAIASNQTLGLLQQHGCVLRITDAVVGPPASLQYLGSVGPWNNGGNTQCAHMNAVWNDGNTTFSNAVLRSYRIRPGDQRGVLEMSPSGAATANDWTPLAVGIVDLQVAIRLLQPSDVTDEDGDLDPTRDWFSGANMDNALGLVANSSIVQVSVTFLAKSSKEVGGATLTQSPDLFEAGKPINDNSVGDHAGIPLPVTDTTSPFYGNFIYRTYTSTVDLRNVAVGL
jgi:prepilin-type N-terminal cleavage/methylation domain-containing protein